MKVFRAMVIFHSSPWAQVPGLQRIYHNKGIFTALKIENHMERKFDT